MLKNTETPNHPTFTRRPALRPILAIDAETNTVYDMASFIKELKHPAYQHEDLAEKLDIFIQLAMQWCDEGTSVATIREMVQVMFRLRDAVAGIKVTCNEQG